MTALPVAAAEPIRVPLSVVRDCRACGRAFTSPRRAGRPPSYCGLSDCTRGRDAVRKRRARAGGDARTTAEMFATRAEAEQAASYGPGHALPYVPDEYPAGWRDPAGPDDGRTLDADRAVIGSGDAAEWWQSENGRTFLAWLNVRRPRYSAPSRPRRAFTPHPDPVVDAIAKRRRTGEAITLDEWRALPLALR